MVITFYELYYLLGLQAVKPNALALGYKHFALAVLIVKYYKNLDISIIKIIIIVMEIAKPTKKYRSSHSIVFSCQYHVIFCPKYRRKVLTDGIDDRLKSLIIEKQKDYDYSVLEMEIMPDHVHLLLDVNPQIGIIKVIAQIKGFTAQALRKEFPSLRSRLPCLWTRSKFVSTVGAVSLETVKQYIVEQKGK